MHKYEVGDVVTYTAFGGPVRHVEVTAKDPDISGRPGFEGTIVGSRLRVWGYDHQITSVQRQVAA